MGKSGHGVNEKNPFKTGFYYSQIFAASQSIAKSSTSIVE